jgi:hypothetical protein
MKKLITAIASLLFITSNAQVVVTNNFSQWSGGNVVGWNGSSTHFTGLTITQINQGTVFGGSAVQLATEVQDQHRRFSSDPMDIEAGFIYNFKYWAKGKGDIRVAVTDGIPNSTNYFYSAYFTLNSDEWIEINQTSSSPNSYTNGQFLFSVRNTDGANGHIQIDSVSVTTGTTIPTLSIYDIQFTNSPSGDSEYIDQSILTGGIVTGVRDTVSVGGYYIQAGTGPWTGIYVFDPSNSFIVSIGDSVTLGGVVEERFNNTQIKNVVGFSIVSSGNTVPEPVLANTVTLATEPYEGVLVRAEEANCTTVPNNFGVWTINDGSGIIRVAPDLYSYSPVIVNTKYNLTGIITYAFSEFRLLPRSANDISIFVGFNDNNKLQFELYPNPAQDVLNIQLPEIANNIIVEMTDLSGKLIRSQQFNASQLIQIETNNLAKGMYLVRITNGLKNSSKLVSIQ